MAKVDFSRDYYADLELPSTADITDIKKQFRKLALKYHPDRNPGKEAEVNAKFQTIQAAHEILTSPEQKTKYDSQRVRTTSRYPTASGVRGNPWQDYGSQYPTPPRRPGQAPTSAARNTPSSSSTRPSASTSSGSRFSSFHPPPREETSKEDLQSRYTAWQKMRPKPHPAPGQSASAAYAAANSGASASTSANARTRASAAAAGASSMPPPPPPRSASQKQKAEASFGTRRNPGFVPSSPMGDEPPAASSSSNYFTHRAHPTRPVYEQPEPPRTPAASGRDSRNIGRESRNGSDEALFDARQSTPYQTHGGEKFSLFDTVPVPDLNRAKSYRATNAQARPEPRRRSSSMPDEPDNVGKATSSSRKKATASGEEAAATSAGTTTSTASTANTSAPRTGNRARPGAAQRASYAPSSSTMPQFEEQYRKMQGEQQQQQHQQPDPFTTPNAKAPRQNGPGDKSNNKGKASIFANLSLDDDVFNSPTTPTDQQQKKSFASISVEDINTRFVSEDNAKTRWEFSAGGTEAEPGNVHRSQSGSRLGRRSPGKPHSILRPDASQAPQVSPQPTPRPASATGAAAAAADGSSTGSATGSSVDSGGASTRASYYGDKKPGANTSTTTDYFDPQRWTEQIGSEHFIPVASQQGPSIPPRQPTPNHQPPRPIKKPKPASRANTSTGNQLRPGRTYTVIDDDSDDSVVEIDGGGMASPVAMDIDSPPKGQPGSGDGKAGARSPISSSPSATTANGVRNIPVEPTRPEWRAGNVDKSPTASAAPTSENNLPPIMNPFSAASAVSAMAAAAAAAEAAAEAAEAAAEAAAAESRKSANGESQSSSAKAAGPTPTPPPPPPTMGSEDSEEFRASLADIRKVEPFAENVSGIQGKAGTGLGSFGDLKSHLPFDSKAATPLTAAGSAPTANRRKTISFPKPPRAPHPPPVLAVPGLQPTTGAWDKYVSEFRHYMAEWNVFNTLYVDHFVARHKDFVSHPRQPRAMADAGEDSRRSDWIAEADNDGIDQYLAWLEQDEQVRARWTQACADHSDNVRLFKRYRDQMRQAQV